MGAFIYEGTTTFRTDDRTLAHLRIVISNKLRRSEPFHFTWAEDVSVGGGRTTVWLHPDASLVYTFHGGQKSTINHAWLKTLTVAAESVRGLRVVREPDDGVSTHPVTPGPASPR